MGHISNLRGSEESDDCRNKSYFWLYPCKLQMKALIKLTIFHIQHPRRWCREREREREREQERKKIEKLKKKKKKKKKKQHLWVSKTCRCLSFRQVVLLPEKLVVFYGVWCIAEMLDNEQLIFITNYS